MEGLRRGVCDDNFDDNLVKAPRRDHMRFCTGVYIKMMRRLLMGAAEVMMMIMMMMMMIMMMMMMIMMKTMMIMICTRITILKKYNIEE